MDESRIEIEFWIDNKVRYALQNRNHVPMIGDEVRFKQIAYKVIYRIWTYDEKYPRVILNMTKVK